jgi:effector-binding domain-containing protein
MNMPGTPEIVTRTDQPYMAISAQLPQSELASLGLRLGEVFAWLGAHGLEPAGAPFFKYDVIDMDGLMDLEAGVPVAVPAAGDGQVVAGVLPSGRYVTVVHVGHPQGLARATGELLDWAAAQGLKWDMSPGAKGEHWGSRLEIYLTDPSQQPDMSKWETQLAFRLAD